jgi:hypothetical protein
MSCGHPLDAISTTVLPGSKSSWTRVSLTICPIASISKVVFNRGSLEILVKGSSLNPRDSANPGVTVCQEYAIRSGSNSRTT